jgi:hypothetical protein
MGGRAIRSLLTVIIDVVIIAAVALAIRLAVLFSGQISSQGWAQAYDAVTRHFVIPFGAHSITTPYHGVFDVNCAFSVLALIAVEWGLSLVRDRA